MNGKFVEKYGLAWKDMDNDARMQAIMSEIFDLREDMSPLKDVCDKTRRHDTYFKGLWAGLTLIVLPILVALLIRSFS